MYPHPSPLELASDKSESDVFVVNLLGQAGHEPVWVGHDTTTASLQCVNYSKLRKSMNHVFYTVGNAYITTMLKCVSTTPLDVHAL